MKVRFFLTILVTAIFLGSCKTDFDVNAGWKDITVVYGILNQVDSVSYIKVNKAFLGEGNALQYAQIPDSSSYGNNLEVKVIEYDQAGNEKTTFVFDTTTIYSKEAGTFYYPEQVVYKYNTLHKLSENNRYKLVITNKITGKVITSETPMVRDFDVNKPRAGQTTIDFASSLPGEVEWISGTYGKRYQVIVRFHYLEINKLNTADTLHKSVDWLVGTKKSTYLTGGETLTLDFQNESFFTFLKDTLAPDPNLFRISGKVDFLFSVAGDEFNTYLEVNEPSNSIIQERPEYTNIVNGIGLFSCRYTKTRGNLYLNQETELKLQALGIGF